MTYPLSSDVSAGQPTAAAHYNNLRRDALYFGQAPADSKPAGEFFARYAANLTVSYLATNRLRLAYSAYNPPAIVIGGCLLQAAASVDLAAGCFSGAAATYYIHAIRAAGSTSFTLSVNTTPTDNDTSRPIGSCYWDGANLSSIQSWYGSSPGLPAPGYDSGWFACAYNTTYTRVHGLGAVPKNHMLLHSASSDGSGENVLVLVGATTGGGCKSLVGFDASNAYITTDTASSGGCVYSRRRESGAGYYRLLCWI